MAKTSVDIPQLKFNKMSTAKYEELKLAGQLNNNEFYITPDGGTIPEVNESTNDFVLSNNGTDLNWVQETEYTKNRIDSKLNDNVRTNCITKIPQDIKLELSEDGTLTLKAGSKVYIPNGFEEDGITRKFDVKIIEEDMSKNAYLNKSSRLCVANNTSFEFYPQYASGATVNRPLPSSNINICYYDIDLNKMFVSLAGAEYVETYLSLPFAIASMENESWLSIDQVFNGFGYIGSTIFALPGIEGLIPNGRNEDGSLNNKLFKNNNVITVSITDNSTFSAPVVINSENTMNTPDYKSRGIFYQPTQPSKAGAWYDTQNNFWYYSGDGINWVQQSIYLYISNNVDFINGRVNNIKFNNIFQAIDKNDKNNLSKLSLPSNTVIPLTLEASGTKYTAPANGWVTIGGGCTGFVSLFNVSNTLVSMIAPRPDNYNFARTYIPVKKGDTFGVDYALFTVEVFLFIYAEGEL